MSASRPKSSRVIQKPRGISALAARIPTSTKQQPSVGGKRKAPTPATHKGTRPVSPISVPSTVVSVSDNDEDDEDEFEEVPIPIASNEVQGDNENEEGEGDEDEDEEDDDGVIHLEIGGETAEEKAKRMILAKRKKPLTARDRALRLEVHKVHVVALLASASVRNKWCNNSLLKARLLSLLPHPLQAAFNIPPSRFPDRAQRSRLFFEALQSLVSWWSQTFFDVSDYALGLRTRPWDEVQGIIESTSKAHTPFSLPSSGHGDGEKSNKSASKGKGKAAANEELSDQLAFGSGAERLRSVNSLMKKALQQEGSRDVSAQLFVALARACGLGVRLVTSLQAVPWRAEKVTTKKKAIGAGKGGRTLASRQGLGDGDEDDDEDEMEEVPIPNDEEKSVTPEAGSRRLKDSADLYRLRKYKPPARKLGTPTKSKPKASQSLADQPPVFWAEVFNRSDQRWIPVDPVRGIIRKKLGYEPPTDSGPVRMLYVVAFEEDGYARDVTLRYTKNFYAKTSKLRVPTKPNEPQWWSDIVMGFLRRPHHLNRDDMEDAELEMSQMTEGMPMHMSGFKDHPIYVLERHLKRDQVLNTTNPVGRFRGEAVYRRSSVQNCKTAESWMRSGRKIKEGQEPLKWVKQRAVTLQKRRAQELAKQEGEEVTQGLYAEWQTEIYRPPPIKDGIIPRNSFGNIDLYVPTMLPLGAVHLPYKGIAKVAKDLGVSYAEACTGFEFKKQRAVPIIKGIVVATEKEQEVLDAYEESTIAAEERERMKREDRALKRWAKLVNGLRLRLRLQQEYGSKDRVNGTSSNLFEGTGDKGETQINPRGTSAREILAAAQQQSTKDWEERVRREDISMDEEDGMIPAAAVERESHQIPLGDFRAPSNAVSELSNVASSSETPRIMLRFKNTSSPQSAALAVPESRGGLTRSQKREAMISETIKAVDDEQFEDPRTTEGNKAMTLPEPVASTANMRTLRSTRARTKEQMKANQAKEDKINQT
ncbi:xeroderma pigmentosum group C-complementing protein [Cryptococcus neoformans Tu259-1]|uniref:Xeroderma pigmentosum group C-complementing protein n=1 Tax=Cryptococcus neoformans Tu259-1 TaxID=1230072 RepID=A0A854QEZ9_CRYNE|nr:xeroderma pigmentosum group C-complementing protein [Cryptococcus neoformans var. grubii Tu259-1]